MAKKLKRTPNPPRVCIFCGGRPISKEHVWSEWTYQYVPRQRGTHTSAIYRASAGIVGLQDARRFTGPVNTRKIEAVCTTCNNGWMSGVETAAKPYLIPMFLQMPVVLRERAQQIVATWIVMKCMVLEWDRRGEDVCSTKDERRYLMEHLSPPPGWKVLIANQSSPAWRTAWNRNASTLGAAPRGQEATRPHDNSFAVNTQSFTLGFGRLLVHAIYSRVPGVRLDPIAPLLRLMRQILPFKAAIIWPFADPIPEPAIYGLATALARWTALLRWRPGQPSTGA